MASYYTICTRDGYVWHPQFGDYDRDTVMEEIEDNYSDYHPDCIRVVCTTDDQKAIDAAAAALNMKDPCAAPDWREGPYWNTATANR